MKKISFILNIQYFPLRYIKIKISSTKELSSVPQCKIIYASISLNGSLEKVLSSLIDFSIFFQHWLSLYALYVPSPLLIVPLTGKVQIYMLKFWLT